MVLVGPLDIGRKLLLIADGNPSTSPDRSDQELAIGDPARLVDDQRVKLGALHELAAADPRRRRAEARSAATTARRSSQSRRIPRCVKSQSKSGRSTNSKF
jgi:hypothetical protein